MIATDNTLPIHVFGHVKITDDLGNTLLDKTNAVHPQNAARVIARALAREDNYYIHRIAFGNGGTIVDAAYTITYKTPNDGQDPDTSEWKSKLYNETYSEIVDDANTNIGTGSGSSSTNDPTTTTSSGPGVRSNEIGLKSQVIIESVLNPFEPIGQTQNDVLGPTEGTDDAFVFDEIGLFTAGSPHSATNGYQDISVSEKIDTDITGLASNTVYTFDIQVDGGVIQTITFNTGVGIGSGGQILYSDLVDILGAHLNLCSASISNSSGQTNTYGALRFTSTSTGNGSAINIITPTTIPPNWLFSNLIGFTSIDAPVAGQNPGDKNNPTNPSREGERLLTHLIFSPVRKSANRTISIIYTLTIQVARSTI